MINYPGAKWWKFDFHTHTPASTDFMKGCRAEDKAKVTPEFWLKKFMAEKIDCVAITDHNSGAWVDILKQTLAELNQNNFPEYHPLTLFPSVEISVNGGVHLLAIFGEDKTQSDIDSLLGAIGYKGTKGNSDEVTGKTISEVIDEITERGGIAIPAHVDKEKSLFKLDSNTLKQVLECPNIHAMELCDETYQKPQLYHEKKIQWTEIKGSDTHNFRQDNFGIFTWVKMDEPTIEGLKLALIDGKASINRNRGENPNQHAQFIIESLTVDKTKYVGRAKLLVCEFSPFLNTFIGGRGSSKSTLLEFTRLVLRQKEAIPESLQTESNKYFQTGDNNLLLKNSKISLIYSKAGIRYRLNWSEQADATSLEVDNNGNWEATKGEIKSLFPAYIYSQKQIFELAKEPQGLLDIIDKDRTVDYENLKQQHINLVNQYKQVEQKLSELNEKIARKNKLQGELDDFSRQIQKIESSGHRSVLENYRKRQQQLTTIKHLEANWQDMANRLQDVQEFIVPVNVSEQVFNENNDILSAIKQSNDKWSNINQSLNDLTQQANALMSQWQQEKDRASWMQVLQKEVADYQQIETQLQQQDIDPQKYPLLLQQQLATKKELENIDAYSSKINRLKKKKHDLFNEIEETRKILTHNRQQFLKTILKDKQAVNIKVIPFGERWKTIELFIRKTLNCQKKYDKDIENLQSIYQRASENNVQALKIAIQQIRNNKIPAKTARFTTHLQNQPQDVFTRLMLWFPKDDLEITFGEQQQNIKQGSAGQKCAALLSFILSYGEEPLLLDQPEDDLDNELIYSLIVKQLRAIKSKRQIIIVTHNANIVVNGNAEMVLPLEVSNGQSIIPHPASIQNTKVREKICTILEGGQHAFSQRYKRIHLEN